MTRRASGGISRGDRSGTQQLELKLWDTVAQWAVAAPVAAGLTRAACLLIDAEIVEALRLDGARSPWGCCCSPCRWW
jgi:ABC-type tungstate transport system permease subunit